MKTLYLCYLGLREPLAQSQVLPYLEEIAKSGVGVRLLTFEPGWPASWSSDDVARWRTRLAERGISWTALRYHKSPSLPATLYDIARGAFLAFQALRRREADVLHARAHVPLVMALLARTAARRGKTVFDIRGLVADEYVDAGVWKKDSPVYGGMKWVERLGILRADRLVVLTDRCLAWLIDSFAVRPEKIAVIPCCADVERYASIGEDEASGRFEVLYAGSVTGLYLLEEMGRFFLRLREGRPDAFLRILTTASASETEARLRGVGLPPGSFAAHRADPAEIPGHLARARVGLSFRLPTFSQVAASPTKIAEYLAAGLPTVSNSGIGDTDQILQEDRVGVVLPDFSEESYKKAIAELTELLQDPALAARCRESARRRFDLRQVGGERYRRLYRSMEPV